jgi:hypothetical protein
MFAFGVQTQQLEDWVDNLFGTEKGNYGGKSGVVVWKLLVELVMHRTQVAKYLLDMLGRAERIG